MNERQKTILVAEDDTEINKLICKILEKGGYRAVSAFPGQRQNFALAWKQWIWLFSI